MNKFNKFLTKYHKQIITMQVILILGAVINQNRIEQDTIGCELKVGIVKVTPPLPNFTVLKEP